MPESEHKDPKEQQNNQFVSIKIKQPLHSVLVRTAKHFLILNASFRIDVQCLSQYGEYKTVFFLIFLHHRFARKKNFRTVIMFDLYVCLELRFQQTIRGPFFFKSGNYICF